MSRQRNILIVSDGPNDEWFIKNILAHFTEGCC